MMKGAASNVFRYGFYTDLDDDELLGYFPLKLEEYNTSGDFAEMDIIFNRRVIIPPHEKCRFILKLSYRKKTLKVHY